MPDHKESHPITNAHPRPRLAQPTVLATKCPFAPDLASPGTHPQLVLCDAFLGPPAGPCLFERRESHKGHNGAAALRPGTATRKMQHIGATQSIDATHRPAQSAARPVPHYVPFFPE